MKDSKKPLPDTLGQYLEQGRQETGLSLRQLATATDIPLTTVARLLRDEVDNPQTDHIQQLARALELNVVNTLAYIGITPPKGLPSVAPYLRGKYKFKGEALTAAAQEIQEIIDKYERRPQ